MNIVLLILQEAGNSEQVLRDHYEDGNATEEEAKEYFSITPRTQMKS